MSRVDGLTAVRLLHRPERADAWLRFGKPVAERRRGRDGVAFFDAGARFAYVDWRAGDYGTLHWSLVIAEACSAGDRLRRWPGILPGALLLLVARGKAAVHRAFAAIDAVEAAGVDPDAVDPDHWRRVANRIAARQETGTFDMTMHVAAVARRALLA